MKGHIVKELPDLPDILLIVREFLQKLAPSLPPGQKFEAQVASYLLEIAQREISEISAEGAVSDRDVVTTGLLCEEIRSGARDRVWDQTLQDALDDTIARVRIVRPSHLAAEHLAS